MWEQIAQVTSGFTLLAFIVAATVFLLRRQISSREKLLSSTPEADRAAVLDAMLSFFRVPMEGLTKEQRYNLVMEQIRGRHKRFNTTAIVVVLVAAVLASISGFAMYQNSQEVEKNYSTVRLLDQEISYRLEPVKNLVASGGVDLLIEASLKFVVFTSLTPNEMNFMATEKRNLRPEYGQYNLNSLFYELGLYVDEKEKGAIQGAAKAAQRMQYLLNKDPKKEVQLAYSVIDDVSILSKEDISEIEQKILPEFDRWLKSNAPNI